MGLRLRHSRQTFALLEALLSRPAHWTHGYELSQHTCLASGTLYPILIRLDKLRCLEPRWEADVGAARPPRHLYRLTTDGREWAREELQAARAAKFWPQAASEAAR